MRPLSLLAPVPIVAGALRGSWWLPTGGGKVWRVLGGTYEPDQTELFRRSVRPGDDVLDLGAHLGYYTLLASRLAGISGRVFAFEPQPRNVAYLRRHAQLNGCRNVEVVEAAVYDRTGEVRFQPGRGSGTGKVAEDGGTAVRAVRLDDFVVERGIVPAVLKIDVEGGERRVLDGAREMLRRDRPLIFLSTHGPERADSCRRSLADLDYRVQPVCPSSRDGSFVCTPAERPRPACPAAIGARA